MANQQKIDFVDTLADELRGSPDGILTDYQGLKAGDFSELRARLRAVGAKYKVVKNRLARLAFQKAGWSGLEAHLKGPSALVYKGENGPAILKALLAFDAKGEKLKLKGGRLFGQVFGRNDLRSIADLPSRKVLLSHLLGRLNGPLQTLAATLNEPVRGLGAVLSALAQKREPVSTS